MSNYSAWTISDLPEKADLEDSVRFVCRYGLLAPSVHNIQPWQMSWNGRRLTIAPDPQHRLEAGDPTGRQTWISLGCIVENLVLAAGAAGLKSRSIPRDDQVELEFQTGAKPSETWVLEAMRERRSDRSAFARQAVSSDQLEQIERAWQSPDILVKASSDRQLIETVAALTGQGIALALSLPEFRNELADLMRPNWTSRGDGLVGKTLLHGALSSLWQPLRFRFGQPAASESRLERQRVLDSGALVLLFSRGDTQPFWLEAGRAYERCALEITRLGLAQSTTAAAVEAPDFHKDIEKALGTEHRLQAIIRIGQSLARAPHSPRRSLDEVLTSTS